MIFAINCFTMSSSIKAKWLAIRGIASHNFLVPRLLLVLFRLINKEHLITGSFTYHATAMLLRSHMRLLLFFLYSWVAFMVYSLNINLGFSDVCLMTKIEYKHKNIIIPFLRLSNGVGTISFIALLIRSFDCFCINFRFERNSVCRYEIQLTRFTLFLSY